MRNRLRRGLLASLLLCSSACAMSRRPAEPLAADCKGGAITVRELDQAVSRYLKQLGRISAGRMFTEAELRDIRLNTLNDLISRRIFLAMAKKEGVTVLDSDVRERYLIVCTGLFDNNEEAFKKALVQDGWTEEEYLANLREIIVAEKMRTQVMQDIDVPRTEEEAYYREHLDEFKVEEMAMRHLLINAPDRDAPDRGLKTIRTQLLEQKVPAESLDVRAAAELKKRENKTQVLLDSLAKGADFAVLARANSEDGSAAQGGDLGRVAKGQMVKLFEEAAFALKKGQISGVIRTEFGFHIIKAESDPAVRLQPFEDVQYAINAKLRAQREAERLAALEKKWKVKRYIS